MAALKLIVHLRQLPLIGILALPPDDRNSTTIALHIGNLHTGCSSVQQDAELPASILRIGGDWQFLTAHKPEFFGFALLTFHARDSLEVRLLHHVGSLAAEGVHVTERVRIPQDKLQANVSTIPASAILRSRVRRVAPVTLAVATRMRSAGSR